MLYILKGEMNVLILRLCEFFLYLCLSSPLGTVKMLQLLQFSGRLSGSSKVILVGMNGWSKVKNSQLFSKVSRKTNKRS